MLGNIYCNTILYKVREVDFFCICRVQSETLMIKSCYVADKSRKSWIKIALIQRA